MSPLPDALSRRERQIIDALHAHGPASARDVAERLGESDGLDTIRVTLQVLERKGLVRHKVDGRRNIYSPRESTSTAMRAAFNHVTSTFFGGSTGSAVLGFLDASREKMTEEELAALSRWVDDQVKRRRTK